MTKNRIFLLVDMSCITIYKKQIVSIEYDVDKKMKRHQLKNRIIDSLTNEMLDEILGVIEDE